MRTTSARIKDQNRALTGRLLLIWFFIPLCLVFFVSVLGRLSGQDSFSIYMDRYLIIVFPPFILMASWGFTRMANLLRKPTIALVPVGIIVIATVPSFLNLYNVEKFARMDFREAFQSLADRTIEDDIIVSRPDILLPLEYYASGKWSVVMLPASYNDGQLAAAFSAEMNGIMQSISKETDSVWYFAMYHNSNAHRFPQDLTAVDDPRKDWLDANFNQIQQLTFTGIVATQYDLMKLEKGENGE